MLAKYPKFASWARRFLVVYLLVLSPLFLLAVGAITKYYLTVRVPVLPRILFLLILMWGFSILVAPLLFLSVPELRPGVVLGIAAALAALVMCAVSGFMALSFPQAVASSQWQSQQYYLTKAGGIDAYEITLIECKVGALPCERLPFRYVTTDPELGLLAQADELDVVGPDGSRIYVYGAQPRCLVPSCTTNP